MGLCWIMLFALVTAPTTEHRYRFTYELSGSARGRILLVFPYRAFYRSRASAIFKAASSSASGQEFFLDRIDEPGIMLRTTGFSGHTLVILTADADLQYGISRGKQMWQHLRTRMDYYPRFVHRVKDFQFRFFRSPAGGIRFLRRNGVHEGCRYNMDVRFRHHPEELRIQFNLYRIMCEMIGLYNHEFRPQLQGLLPLGGCLCLPGYRVSQPLDFSFSINAIAGLASRFVGSLRDFNQEVPFRLFYHLAPAAADRICIQAVTKPDVRIWGRFKIKHFSRRVFLDKGSGRLLQDELYARIDKGRGGGMTVTARLELLQ